MTQWINLLQNKRSAFWTVVALVGLGAGRQAKVVFAGT